MNYIIRLEAIFNRRIVISVCELNQRLQMMKTLCLIYSLMKISLNIYYLYIYIYSVEMFKRFKLKMPKYRASLEICTLHTRQAETNL